MSCEHTESVTISKATYDELIAALTLNIANDQRQLELDHEALSDKMSELGGYKYESILMANNHILFYSHKLDELINPFYERLKKNVEIPLAEKQSMLDTLERFIYKQDTDLFEQFEKVLTEQMEVLALKPEELGVYIQNMAQALAFLRNSDKIMLSKAIEADDIFRLKLYLLQQIGLKHQRFFEDKFLDFTRGNQLCGFSIQYPVLLPKKGCLELGEYFEAEASVATYPMGVNPENIRIVINGDTLRLNEDGLSSYKMKPKKRGELLFNMECILEHPLTGKLHRNTSEYRFVVN